MLEFRTFISWFRAQGLFPKPKRRLHVTHTLERGTPLWPISELKAVLGESPEHLVSSMQSQKNVDSRAGKYNVSFTTRMLGDFCHMTADRPLILFSVKWNNNDSIDGTGLWGYCDLQHQNSHAQYVTDPLCVLVLCQGVRGWVNSELIGLWLIDSVLPLTSCVTKVELKCFYRSRFSLCKINAIILLFTT